MALFSFFFKLVRWGKIRRMVPFIPSYIEVQVVRSACFCAFDEDVIKDMLTLKMMFVQREMAEEAVEEGKEARQPRLSLLVTDLQVS